MSRVRLGDPSFRTNTADAERKTELANVDQPVGVAPRSSPAGQSHRAATVALQPAADCDTGPAMATIAGALGRLLARRLYAAEEQRHKDARTQVVERADDRSAGARRLS